MVTETCVSACVSVRCADQRHVRARRGVCDRLCPYLTFTDNRFWVAMHIPIWVGSPSSDTHILL